MNKYEEAILELETHCLQKDDEDYNFLYGTYIPYVEHKKYSDSVKLLKELVERATSKKLIYKEYEVYHDYAFCQNNHKIGVMPYCKNKKKYCPYCGQALDWNDQ